MRRRIVSVLGLAAAAVALVATSGSVGTVDAGIGPPTRDITVRVAVAGSQVPSAATYVPTVTPNGGGGVVGACTVISTTDNGFATRIDYSCTVMIGDTYTVAVPAPPPPFSVETQCAPPGVAGDEVVVGPEGIEPGCVLVVSAPTVFLDKRIVGVDPGPLVHSDFVLEVYPAAGGAPVATANDPGVEDCSDPFDAGVDCGYVEVPLGNYVLGEQREYGYFPGLATCRSEPLGGGDGGGGGELVLLEPAAPEVIVLPDDSTIEFSLTEADRFIFCLVLNVYVEGTINITKTVINDDDGTAGPADWTVELYDDTSTLVTSVPCNADGTCLSGDFPIGAYTVGEEGPDGYSTSVSLTVTPPDESLFPGDGGGDRVLLPLGEAIDDPNATFDLEPLAVVDIEIVNDDQPTTTTTTTTTLVPTTTVVPTSAAPTSAAPTSFVTTTAFDSGAATLPATGGGDGGTRNVALVALVLLGFGLTASRLARR